MPIFFLFVLVLLGGCGRTERGTVLQRGMDALARDRVAEALPLLRKAVELSPDSATAQGNLGIALWRAGELDAAAEAFRRATALSGNDSRALAFLGHVSMQMGDWPRAAMAFDLALKEDPKAPSLLTAHAHVQRRLGQRTRARDLLHQALESDPGYAPALYGMAILEQQAGDGQQAATFYRQFLAACSTGPEADNARAFLARHDASSGDTGEPDRDSPAAAGVRRLVDAARRAVERHEYESAVVNLKRAVDLFPDEPDPLWELARLYDRQLGFKDRAAECYRDFKTRFATDPRTRQIPALPPPAPRADPNETARVSFARGVAAYEAGDWARAIREFKRTLAFDRNHADAAYNLGLACKEAGALDDARREFLKVLEMRPDMPDARYMIAVIARKQGHPGEAITQLRLVLGKRPRYSKAHLLLGYVYEERGQSAEARKHFEEYVRQAPDEPAAGRIRKWLERRN